MWQRWNSPRDMSSVHRTQVFSGGACNILDENGHLLRNAERDRINDWMTAREVVFFDPQIHPDTHGIEYDYGVHQPLEMAARKAAKVNLYEVSPRSFGGITSLEIAVDRFRWLEPMVVYYSDADPDRDDIPAYSRMGHPLFVPTGIMEHDAAMKAHYREFRKNGNNMRRYLLAFARETSTLTVTFGAPIHARDVVINPDRMHAVDLFRAIVRANSGERVFVNFTGGDKARDEKGNPLFLLPEHPTEMEMKLLLDQYVDEGNELRKAIVELVQINVFVRVVYTQQSAILALEELLRLKNILRTPV